MKWPVFIVWYWLFWFNKVNIRNILSLSFFLPAFPLVQPISRGLEIRNRNSSKNPTKKRILLLGTWHRGFGWSRLGQESPFFFCFMLKWKGVKFLQSAIPLMSLLHS